MRVRTLSLFILFLVSTFSFSESALAQYQSGKSKAKLETGPVEFVIGWQGAGDITVNVPLQTAMTVQRQGSFFGSVGYRPQDYITFTLSMVNSPVASSTLDAEHARLTADENAFSLGGSFATGFMQPHPRSGFMMRFRGGGTFGLTTTDLRLQNVQPDNLVHERRYAGYKEHSLFMGVDAGLRDVFGQSTGVFFITLLYNRCFYDFSGLPVGAETQVGRDRVRFGVGITL